MKGGHLQVSCELVDLLFTSRAKRMIMHVFNRPKFDTKKLTHGTVMWLFACLLRYVLYLVDIGMYARGHTRNAIKYVQEAIDTLTYCQWGRSGHGPIQSLFYNVCKMCSEINF